MVFLSIIFIEILAFASLVVTGEYSIRTREDETKAKITLVSTLGLTDLALWTEARYTRHPSQADYFTPFQDFPAAIDHFPAGSIISPGSARPSTKINFSAYSE